MSKQTKQAASPDYDPGPPQPDPAPAPAEAEPQLVAGLEEEVHMLRARLTALERHWEAARDELREAVDRATATPLPRMGEPIMAELQMEPALSPRLQVAQRILAALLTQHHFQSPERLKGAARKALEAADALLEAAEEPDQE